MAKINSTTKTRKNYEKLNSETVRKNLESKSWWIQTSKAWSSKGRNFKENCRRRGNYTIKRGWSYVNGDAGDGVD